MQNHRRVKRAPGYHLQDRAPLPHLHPGHSEKGLVRHVATFGGEAGNLFSMQAGPLQKPQV